ncbi:MAG: S1C family serine protease [Patescibacteria group bacterium]
MSTKSLRWLFIGTIVASLALGGISGLLVSGWLRADRVAADWVDSRIFGSLSGAPSANTAARTTLQVTTEESATIETVQKVSPAVVSIVITQDLGSYSATAPFDLFGFSIPSQESQGEQEVGAGTGFIVSSDGMILTNKHVVSDVTASYTVVMNDGKKYDAQILDTDPLNDLALIKIDAEQLLTVSLGDSDSLSIGQTVIAIGNTLGEYSNTVTRGVISGLARTVTAGTRTGQSETLENIIQTDAAINFGNSGGPLVNLNGEVIGVNTAISQQGQLVGFAIPINQAKQVIESVQEYGYIVRPYLGVRYMVINKDIAEQNDLSVDYGALVVRGSQPADLAIIPGSPADKAGIQENDIILSINDQVIDEDHSLAHELQKYKPGDTITLKVLSKGEEKIITATLAESTQ